MDTTIIPISTTYFRNCLETFIYCVNTSLGRTILGFIVLFFVIRLTKYLMKGVKV